VNDLDLRIVEGPTTHFPWILDPANPAAAATTGDNFRDNVEQVEVFDAATGGYTLEVSHKGGLLGASNQDYSLIISVNPPPPAGGNLLIDEDFSGGLPPGWSVETSSGVPWTIRTPVPEDPRYDNFTGGEGNFAMVDNNYTNNSLTSLVTPVLDLSENLAAVLSFRSHFYFDLLETIHVDISTNSGANWTNVWEWIGFNPSPTNYVFDLSDELAGHSGVMVRFRYDSNGDVQGNYWQVDDVQLEVFGGEGPPPARSVSTVPYTVLGVQHVEINWENFTTTTVEITRDGISVTGLPTENDGVHVDNLGVKGEGVTYVYHVCETLSHNCASATATF
jgi:hypothetical protein